MGKKNKVTFHDIAVYTNFSKTTISRYFNNPDSLTEENQKIIADALVALDYKENKVARILASGSTEFVGIIIPNLYLHYYSEMLNQILSSYQEYGYKFLVFVGNDDAEVERNYIKELMAYQIEGLIVLSHTIPSKELADYRIPIVAIEREDQYISSINTDNYMGAVQATSLLIKNQCSVLIHINNDVPNYIPAYGRIKGFQDICGEEKIPHEIIYCDLGSTFEASNQKLAEIFEDLEKRYPNQKKGIFMPNDTHANVLLNIIIRQKGTLGSDYRIVGFDDSPISKEAIIPITTVGQQISLLAQEAVKLLVSQMSERKKRRPNISSEPIHKKIPPVLVRRDTTDHS